MSSPKEKAEDLYCKYDSLFKAPFKKHQQLKECALIAVDEIEQALTDYGRGNSLQLQNMDSEFRFWEQVKQEIEKL